MRAVEQAFRIEKRLVWRYLLLAGWATFRAGRNGAGELVARALTEALSCGSVEIARSGEPVLVSALAPLGERAQTVSEHLCHDGALLDER